MSADDSSDLEQEVDEVAVVEKFRTFRNIFFDPLRSRQRFANGRTYYVTRCENSFVDAANNFKLLKTVSETANETKLVAAGHVSHTDEEEAYICECNVQPDVVRSAEGSDLSPTSPDVIPEMDDLSPKKQCPRRAFSYEEPMNAKVQVQRQMSDSFVPQRVSSAYGSGDQSLVTVSTDQSTTEVTTPDTIDEPTAVFSSDRSRQFTSSLRMDVSSSTVSAQSNTGNIPFEVSQWQLTANDDFEPSTNDSYVTTVDDLDQFPQASPQHSQAVAVDQPSAYQELYRTIAELQNRVIQGLLAGLVYENRSLEFVQSVAEALLLSAADARDLEQYERERHERYLEPAPEDEEEWTAEVRRNAVDQLASVCDNNRCTDDTCTFYKELIEDVRCSLYSADILRPQTLHNRVLRAIICHTADCSEIHCTVPWCYFFSRRDRSAEDHIAALRHFLIAGELAEPFDDIIDNNEANLSFIQKTKSPSSR